MNALLEMKNISKSFSKNRVLEDVNFQVQAGEVHALLGENGAGKSTLIKIMGGIYPCDSGQILIDGELCTFSNAQEAQAKGISIIHQELMLMPHLSIAENIFMGRELHTRAGFLDIREQERRTQELLDDFEMGFSAGTRLDNLTIAQQQMVEIIRAISFQAKIIAMDEPTSSLSERESERLFELIRSLKEKNVGIILISHRLNDIFALSDRVTVLRDGICTGTREIQGTSNDELIRLMVGRDIAQYYAAGQGRKRSETVVMSVRNLSDGRLAKDVSFDLKKGEILGVSGLVGAGRSEMLQCIFGLSKRKSGSVVINGRETVFHTPKDAIEGGLGYVCEDRKKQGLFLKQSVCFNITVNVLESFMKPMRYLSRAENELAESYVKKLAAKVTGISQTTGTLSGGNQQKVLISRWLASTTDILLLDEPTRGVDVATKQDIYQLIGELAVQGISIVFVSSELTELLNVCDRIMVMSNGKTTGTLMRGEFSQEEIMRLATREFRGNG